MNVKHKIKKNAVDRVMEYVSPRAAVRRYHARAVLALTDGYSGASKSLRSMFGFNPGGGDADSWLKNDRQTLIDRSHSLTRNNPLVSGIISSNCTNIIGSGLKLQSRVDLDILGLSEEDAENLENVIEREWRLWSESQDRACDIHRISTFSELQELALRQVFTSGEAFAMLTISKRTWFPYGLSVQLIEPDRICNTDKKMDGYVQGESGNYLYEGIEKDTAGVPVRYHVCSDYPTNYTRNLTWSKINAFMPNTGLRNILHLYKLLRPGQSRGVPYLAPVMEPLYNLGRYSKAEIDAAVVSSLFTVFIKTESGDSEGIMQPSSEVGGSASDADIKLGPGAVVDLRQGESIETTNPGRPNSNFDPFVQAIIRQIGIALELPYEVLIKHFESSYSASRAALLEAWRFYKTRRQWFAQAFCQPIFTTFMYEAVARGRIAAPGFFDDPIIRQAYLGAEWVGPAQGHIDPTKEVTAAQTRMKECITTLAQETMEYNGGQVERNMKQISKEMKMKRAMGIVQDPIAPQTPPASQPDDDSNNAPVPEDDASTMFFKIADALVQAIVSMGGKREPAEVSVALVLDRVEAAIGSLRDAIHAGREYAPPTVNIQVPEQPVNLQLSVDHAGKVTKKTVIMKKNDDGTTNAEIMERVIE